MIKKIGFHTGDGWFQYLDLIKRWQPPVVTILSPNKEQIKALRAACPNTIIIGRIYVDDAWADKFLQSDPIGFAQHTNKEIRNLNIPEVNYWVMNNEPTPYWDRLPAINTYNLELMKLAVLGKYKVGILSVSVGNFDLPKDNPMAYWQQISECLKFAQQYNFPVLMHQYQKPNLINNNEDDNWLIFRLEKKVLPGLRDMGLGELDFIITEVGVDHLINNGGVGGFQKTPLKDEDYFHQLLQWEKVEQDYPQILGGCIFMLGSQNPWQSYSITNNSKVAEMLANHYTNTEYDGVKPMTDNKVLIPSVKKDDAPAAPIQDIKWDNNLTRRGVVLRPYQPKDGETYWKLIEAEYLGEVKEHTFVDTLDKDGKPLAGTTVKFFWSDGQVQTGTRDIGSDPYALGMVNFPMTAHSNSYGVRVDVPNSDEVWGVGLGSIDKPDWNIHVSYKFIFKLVTHVAKKKPSKKPTEVKPTEPTPTPTPISEPPQGDSIPFRGKVTATVLNVRSEPKMGNNVVNKLANGAVVDVTEHTADGWYKIGENQYVSDQFVEKYQLTDELVNSLLDNFSRMLRIDSKAVRATFDIESGGLAFGTNGKPIIRFENHVFFNQFKNSDVYYKYFKHDSNVHSHRWRKDENSEWVEFHGNQKLEWQVYEFAKTLNEGAATNSISMGMAQIMGFNHHHIGYLSSMHMLDAFSQHGAPGYVAQIFAFFGFCQSKQGLMDHLRNKNWLEFALIYNGAASYANLLEDRYNLLSGGK